MSVIKEIQIDMLNFESFREDVPGERNPGLGDVLTPKHANSRAYEVSIAVPVTALAVQKAAHEREEGHKFLVMPLLELGRLVPEFIRHFFPYGIRACRVQTLPMILKLGAARVAWNQLCRPKSDLREFFDVWQLKRFGVIHSYLLR